MVDRIARDCGFNFIIRQLLKIPVFSSNNCSLLFIEIGSFPNLIQSTNRKSKIII